MSNHATDPIGDTDPIDDESHPYWPDLDTRSDIPDQKRDKPRSSRRDG
jgi:hypothetical protein